MLGVSPIASLANSTSTNELNASLTASAIGTSNVLADGTALITTTGSSSGLSNVLGYSVPLMVGLIDGTSDAFAVGRSVTSSALEWIIRARRRGRR